MNYRVLEQAKRCQLLAGSFEGNERSCPCMTGKDCVFSCEQRQDLDQHPEVVKRREENYQLFMKMENTDERGR